MIFWKRTINGDLKYTIFSNFKFKGLQAPDKNLMASHH